MLAWDMGAASSLLESYDPSVPYGSWGTVKCARDVRDATERLRARKPRPPGKCFVSVGNIAHRNACFDDSCRRRSLDSETRNTVYIEQKNMTMHTCENEKTGTASPKHCHLYLASVHTQLAVRS